MAASNSKIKFSICIDPVYTDYDYYDRIKIAAEQGFDGIELWDIASLDIDKVRITCENSNIRIANFNCLDAWNKHMGADTPVVVKNMKETLKMAKAVNAHNVLVLAGYMANLHDNQKNIMITNLKRIAETAEMERVQVSIEPLNSIVDHKNYSLVTSADGFEIVRCVNSDYIKMVFDIYHMQIMEGNVIANMTHNIGLIGHIHSAACPARHEHFLGENDYRNIIKAVEESGYGGYFGSEYFPSYDSRQSPLDVFNYLKSYSD